MPQRAPALPPEVRREAIIEATLPLLKQLGAAVSTRQIACAAGVAEGTIFRAFPDKDALIRAAVERLFDPTEHDDAIAAIPPDGSFEDRLCRAVAIIQQRTADLWRVASALGPESMPPSGPPPDLPALVRLFVEADADLRVDPLTASRQLRALTLAVSHPLLIADDPMAPAEIVALLLHGIRSEEA